MNPIANARMYAVTPEAEAAWMALLAHVAAEAGVALTYERYPAPQPLEILWRRPDLGAVFMCGYPIALGLAQVVPLASPIPAAPWATGKALYRSDFVVQADSRFRTLEETFGGTIGWTVEHSHSGFNAPRHHLLALRRQDGIPLYRKSVGGLVTARGIVDAVIDRRIDVGPLDGYWHLLLQRHRPDLTDQLRVVASTDLAPLPALVAAPGLPAENVEALRRCFADAAVRPWFAPLAETLCLQGFAPVTRESFAVTRGWASEAEAAGYLQPG
ncbi:MAG: phosphate/phosphite/phosphonate ABC transporter substrate-binding protein [Janthinobacterium lividum]